MMRADRPNTDQAARDAHEDSMSELTSRPGGDDTAPAENSGWILTSGAAR
jgi:hypothetical protein